VEKTAAPSERAKRTAARQAEVVETTPLQNAMVGGEILAVAGAQLLARMQADRSAPEVGAAATAWTELRARMPLVGEGAATTVMAMATAKGAPETTVTPAAAAVDLVLPHLAEVLLVMIVVTETVATASAGTVATASARTASARTATATIATGMPEAVNAVKAPEVIAAVSGNVVKAPEAVVATVTAAHATRSAHGVAVAQFTS